MAEICSTLKIESESIYIYLHQLAAIVESIRAWYKKCPVCKAWFSNKLLHLIHFKSPSNKYCHQFWGLMLPAGPNKGLKFLLCHSILLHFLNFLLYCVEGGYVSSVIVHCTKLHLAWVSESYNWAKIPGNCK